MTDSFTVLYEGGTAEIVEKKSRFIASLSPAKTQAEALLFIDGIKKRYRDAKHYCYAYTCGKDFEIQRFSDDGEPSGTAGRPILEVLTEGGARDAVLVVTRYFGGILLGAGLLARTYVKSAKAALSASVLKVCVKGFRLNVVTDYNSLGNVMRVIEKLEASHRETYGQDVSIIIEVRANRMRALLDGIAEVTSGSAVAGEPEECLLLMD